MRSIVQVNEERTIFQLLFLKEDGNQSVEVEEVEDIDFEKVKQRLEQGESVFITRKRKQKRKARSIATKDSAEPWYLTHI